MFCTLPYQDANHVVRTKCWSRKGRGMWEDLRLKRLKVARSQGQIRCYLPAQAVRQAAACMYLGTCRHIWAAYRQTQEHTKTNALASWR